MHSKRDNIEIMSRDKANEFIEEIGLETSVRGSNFIFDCVNLLHYKCYKINFERGGSYIDSPGWIKNLKKQQ